MPRIVELALLGVRQMQSMTRLAFGPGLNVLSGGVGTGKSTLCELIAVLLCPELTNRFRPFVHPHHPERAQAAVVFQAVDGGFYRVIRDFVKDRINLTKIESPGQTAGGLPPLASDVPSVTAEVQRLLPGVTAEQIARHWLFSPARLSSLPASPSGVGNSNGSVTGGHLPATGPAGPSSQSPAVRPQPASGSRLEELKHALAKAEETLVLDEQAMAAQDRASTLKQKLVQVARLSEERDALQNELKGFAGFDQLPAGYVALIEGLAERERTMHSQLDAARTQLQELEADQAALSSQPIFQQRRFQFGAGLIVLALLIALFVNLPGLFRYVFLALLFPGLGILVWSVVSDMRIQSARTAIDGKIKSLKKEQENAEKQFNREQKPALELLALTKSNSVGQFKERTRNVNRLREQIEQLAMEQTQLLGGQTVDQLQQQLQTLTQEAHALEERVREAASIASKTGMGDVASLQAEIARLESGGTVAPTLDFAELTGAEAPPQPGQTVSPPSVTWMEVLRDVWPHDHPALQSAVSTLFGKLSGGGYSKAAWSNNRLHIETRDQREVDPDLLSSGQRDLLAVACFLAPWLAARADKSPEKLPVTLGRFPLLLDDPFQSLDQAAQSAFIQLLRSLGAAQQILLATRLPVAEHAGDHRLTLPLVAAGPSPAQAAQAKPSR
jgi:energy-coupling factor transporter ATP-binding protein EcfA2